LSPGDAVDQNRSQTRLVSTPLLGRTVSRRAYLCFTKYSTQTAVLGNR